MKRQDGSSFWRSHDGRTWERLSIISDAECATETAFDFLPDGRAIAFVRHDCGSQRSEIKISAPPYADWETLLTFPFIYQGPCLKLVGDTVVISGRVFAEDTQIPLHSQELAENRRGVLLMTVDVEGRSATPTLLIPHSTGPITIDDQDTFPDISYADIREECAIPP